MLDYNSISVQKSGYKYYVSFLDKNNEDISTSEVWFDEEEIENDVDCLINVKTTWCDSLQEREEELDEEDENYEEMKDEIDEEFYELRTEIYDNNIDLVASFCLLNQYEDGAIFYLRDNKLYVDTKFGTSRPIFNTYKDFLNDYMNKEYTNEETKIKYIKEVVKKMKG